MINLAIRVVVNAIALWVAASLVDGIDLSESYSSVLLVAVIFGIVNALVKPVAKALSFPAIVLTLGLFLLVVNAAMLGLTAWLTDGLAIDGAGPALLGAIVISVVSWALSLFLPERD